MILGGYFTEEHFLSQVSRTEEDQGRGGRKHQIGATFPSFALPQVEGWGQITGHSPWTTSDTGSRGTGSAGLGHQRASLRCSSDGATGRDGTRRPRPGQCRANGGGGREGAGVLAQRRGRRIRGRWGASQPLEDVRQLVELLRPPRRSAGGLTSADADCPLPESWAARVLPLTIHQSDKSPLHALNAKIE